MINLFKDLSLQLKIIIIILLIIAIYFIYKKIIKPFLEKRNQNDTLGKINSDINSINQKQTISDGQLSSYSLKLVNAFDGCGTSWGSVKSVISSLNNDADILKLIKIYGIKKYDVCGLFTGDNNFTLIQAIEDDLDSSEILELNTIMALKNIKFRF